MAIVNEAANVGVLGLRHWHVSAEDGVAPTGSTKLIITSADASTLAIIDLVILGLSSIRVSAHTPTVVLQSEE
jgi:hypothetical protein